MATLASFEEFPPPKFLGGTRRFVSLPVKLDLQEGLLSFSLNITQETRRILFQLEFSKYFIFHASIKLLSIIIQRQQLLSRLG